MKAGTRTAPAATVDGYLAALPEEQRAALEKIRHAIKAAAPNAEEMISYQIPTYKYKGALVHFAAFKNHLSFYGVSKEMMRSFAKELAPFEIANTTIHFTPGKPLPVTLVKKMVKARIKENEERVAAKTKRK